jgi:hypothetical protein
MTTARYQVAAIHNGTYRSTDFFEAHSRAQFVAAIEEQFALFFIPKTCMRQVGVRDLWGSITRHGSSCAHFGVEHNGFVLQFQGLTEDEFAALEAAL